MSYSITHVLKSHKMQTLENNQPFKHNSGDFTLKDSLSFFFLNRSFSFPQVNEITLCESDA